MGSITSLIALSLADLKDQGENYIFSKVKASITLKLAW